MSGSTCESLELPSLDLRGTTFRPLARQTVRVLHVINGEHYSGAERVQDLLALNLPRFGYEVDFALLKPGRFANMRQARDAAIIPAAMQWRGDLRPAWRLAGLIRQQGYQLVHTHTPRAALIGRIAAALARVPLVHHVHSPTANDSTRGRQDQLNAWIERSSLKAASAVVTVSRSLARYTHRQGINALHVHVVPNGVPTCSPLPERAVPTGAWTLGTIALFRPRKGLEVLLEALALLRAEGRAVKLRAVGDFETPEYAQQIHARVAQLGIADLIQWTGFSRDVPGELAKMDLLVLPSLFGEGLPMVVLEAMAAGVPVVGTRVEGVPEAIRDRIDGLLAEPNNPQDLAVAIRQIADGRVDWAQLRRSAHRRQASEFSDASMARGVADVYHQVFSP